MITIKTPEEIDKMRRGGRILAKILNKICLEAQPGVSTYALNDLAEKLIAKNKAEPSFKGFEGFPASLCTAVNSRLVHAIPSKKEILKKGDIIGLDLGIRYQDYCTDMAKTIGVGKINKKAKELLRVTSKALETGIKQVKPGNYIGDIGFAIQKYIESRGFFVVKSLVGHGVGRKAHEEPRIPNYGSPKTGPKLEEEMTLAIEPMANFGTEAVRTLADGWTVEAADGSLAAHFEHTVAVTKSGFEILTQE